jgi:hypothetical protein
MVVNNAIKPIEAVCMGVLKMDPILYGTKIVAEMDKACWLDSGKDYLLCKR